MDLMILIVVLLGAFLLYYLIETIRSLHQEIKEIKNKCVTTNDGKNNDIKFETKTNDPVKGINNVLVNNLSNLKNYFDINK